MMRIGFLIQLLVFGSLLSCCAGPKNQNSAGTGNALVFQNETFTNASIFAMMEKAGKKQIQQLEFINCNFQGETGFGNSAGSYHGFSAGLLFKDCSFEGDVNLQAVSFAGQADFSKCRFKKNLILKNSVFLAPFAFRNCGIDGEAGFQNCTFLKESTWMGSYFYNLALFQGSSFMKPAQFQNVHFSGNADFTQCRFGDGAIFDFCIATGKLDFTESRQEGLMTFRKSALKKGAQLIKFRSFAPLKFSETEFEDSLQVRGFRWFAEKPEILNPQGSKKPERLFE